MSTPIYTSFWGNRELSDLSCQPVGISRGVPKFRVPYRYRLLRELAPSREAFALEDPDAFTASYLRHLEEIGAQAILDRLERLSGGRPVVALCFEKPHETFCHRWVLARWIEEQTGTDVPELRAGDLPHREDAAEIRLF